MVHSWIRPAWDGPMDAILPSPTVNGNRRYLTADPHRRPHRPLPLAAKFAAEHLGRRDPNWRQRSGEKQCEES